MASVVLLLCILIFLPIEASPLFFFFKKMEQDQYYNHWKSAQKSAKFLKCYLTQQSPFHGQRRFLGRRLLMINADDGC
uniref:Secreted protein n=1 Tax=Steinernema glaseri TaxID=37863 RepID=A0A1I7YJ24_9BILA